ncbi:MAG: TetR/AcrR family transcriptional regulator [Kineosporiaceae bacterium]
MSDTRDRLISSTQDLLWERGYSATSPKAIQERAGAGQGSMYHHFEGKADLAEAAIRRTAEEMVPRSRARLAGPGTPLERLRAYLTAEREVLRGCRVGRLVQDQEVVAEDRLREPIAVVFSSAAAAVAAVVREAQAAGQTRDDVDADQIAALVLTVIQGGYVLARAAQDEKPFHDAVEAALGLLTRHDVVAGAN